MKCDPLEQVENAIREIVKKDKHSSAAQYYRKVYLDSICLAHTWWMEAQLKGSPAEACFKRMLEDAKSKYVDIFGPYDSNDIKKVA